MIRGENIRGEACKQAANAIARCSANTCAYCGTAFVDGDLVKYTVEATWKGGKARDVGALVYHDHCMHKAHINPEPPREEYGYTWQELVGGD